MALDNFRAPTLPNPPSDYDPQYIRQLIRAIELYFGQLDSTTPNHAEKYTGTFVATGYTTTQKNTLVAKAGTIIFDTTLGKLCVYTGSAWQTVTST
jgi:hypothetical protein